MPLIAGAATRDISPQTPMALHGYPHVLRLSTGVHDPLLVSVLMLTHGHSTVVLISLDLLFVDPPTARQIRRRIADRLQIAESGVFISCTHTHSGPVAASLLSWSGDTTIPLPDPAYLRFVGDQTVAAATQAANSGCAASVAWTSANATGVGGNRLAANGLTDPEAALLAVRGADRADYLAVAVVYGMHPTVLHEDSTLISSDFPHYARATIAQSLPGNPVVIYHTAPCGDQSPRYFVKTQTFAEAERLGSRLGEAAVASVNALTDSAF